MLSYWWRLLCAFVKSISFAFCLLWPFSCLSLPILLYFLVCCVDTVEHHPPSFPVSLYGLTATLLARSVPPAPCCLVAPQPASHLPFRGWRALVDFFCSVISLSVFMHALMSSACPISLTSLISCFASFLLLVGYTL